jgi:hypothetical protein
MKFLKFLFYLPLNLSRSILFLFAVLIVHLFLFFNNCKIRYEKEKLIFHKINCSFISIEICDDLEHFNIQQESNNNISSLRLEALAQIIYNYIKTGKIIRGELDD